jgi:prolyl-tRNA editing enzyme YbaK/EbsC (Cys-tRNA(Pro) deacylase)
MRSSVDVHNYLIERDVRHELFTVRGRLRTPERLAAVLELPSEQVGRVVLYETDEEPVAALVPSDRAPDPKRVKDAVDTEELRQASASRASELSDFIPDAIPPVALPPKFRILMDRALAKQEVVYFHGGDSTAVLKIRGRDLARASGATIVDLA